LRFHHITGGQEAQSQWRDRTDSGIQQLSRSDAPIATFKPV